MSNTLCKEAIASIEISKNRDSIYGALSKIGMDVTLPIGKLMQNHRDDFAAIKVLLAAKNQLQFIENNPR